MPNYIEIIGRCFDSVEASVVQGGDPTIYTDIVWSSTPIPQATLDAGDCTGSLVTTSVNLESGEGIILPLTFNHESTAKNKWLSHEGDTGLSSDETPAIIPFSCKLVGMTFSNSKNSVETDVEVYQTPKNSSTRTLDSTWQIRASRSGYKTNVVETIFEAGSKIGIYLRDKGTDPKRVVVILYVQILQLLPEENTEDYTTSDDD